MYYEPILRSLYHHGVRYLIVGGLAVNLHGIPRMTTDLDIVLATDHDNLTKLLICLNELGFYPSLPIPAEDILDSDKRQEWIDEKNMIAFTFINESVSMGEVDIVLQNAVDFEEAFQKRTVLVVDDYEIYLISILHLQQMKRNTGREQDNSDIEMLKRIKHDKFRI